LVKSYRKLMTTTRAVLRYMTTMVRRLDQRMAEQRRGTHSTDSIYDAEVSVLRAEGGRRRQLQFGKTDDTAPASPCTGAGGTGGHFTSARKCRLSSERQRESVLAPFCSRKTDTVERRWEDFAGRRGLSRFFIDWERMMRSALLDRGERFEVSGTRLIIEL